MEASSWRASTPPLPPRLLGSPSQISPVRASWNVGLSAAATEVVAMFKEAGTSGSIYTSPDSGATWTQTSAPPERWASVASSADGSKLVAVVKLWGPGEGLIYTSP